MKKKKSSNPVATFFQHVTMRDHLKSNYDLYKKCLESAVRLQERELVVKEKFDALQNVLCPSQYPVFFEDLYVSSFIYGVRLNNEKLANDIKTYIYEVVTMDRCEGTGVSGKEYNCKDLDEYILFCFDS